MEHHRVITLHRSRRGKLTAALAGTLFLAASAQVAGASTDTTEPAETTSSEAVTSEPMDDMTDGTMTDGTMPDLSGLGGDIRVSGSSTVEPISSAVANAFADLAPGVAVSVDGPGTSDGFARFCAGETDVSDASRPIAAAEVETCGENDVEFIELAVAIDGLSVITSAENTDIECLSFVDLWALLGPDATGVNNWADASDLADEVAETVTDLGEVHTPYPDAPLTVTAPGEESGTFDSFIEIVLDSVGDELEAEDTLPRIDYTASPDDNVIIEGVGANPTSIGWVGFAFVEENLDVVRPISIDGGDGCVEPTPETIASGEYPISRTLYIYVNTASLAENPALEAYVDFYVSEGMTTLVGTEEGQVPYVPLNEEATAATQAVWEDRETGTRDGGE
jgi:phosphate transport system substrate-binding protein